MNWLELEKRIGLMTPEEKLKPALIFDENEGMFCQLVSMEMYDDPDSSLHGTLYLEQDDKWWN